MQQVDTDCSCARPRTSSTGMPIELIVFILKFDDRYLRVEVDEQDTQSKENTVTEMYVTVLERFNIALHKASILKISHSVNNMKNMVSNCFFS